MRIVDNLLKSIQMKFGKQTATQIRFAVYIKTYIKKYCDIP